MFSTDAQALPGNAQTSPLTGANTQSNTPFDTLTGLNGTSPGDKGKDAYTEHTARGLQAADQLGQIYQSADDQLVKVLIAATAAGAVASAARRAAVMAQVTQVLTQMGTDAARYIGGAVNQHYVDCRAAGFVRLGRRVPPLSDMDRQQIELMDEGVAQRITNGAAVIGGRMQSMLNAIASREAGAQTLSQVSETRASLSQAETEAASSAARNAVTSADIAGKSVSVAMRQLAYQQIPDATVTVAQKIAAAADQAGVTFDGTLKTVKPTDGGTLRLVQAGSRNMRLQPWAEMVARTSIGEASTRATLATLSQAGHDVVRWSVHENPKGEMDDACASRQGQLFSVTGDTPGVPMLTAEDMPPVHPNCWHFIVPAPAP